MNRYLLILFLKRLAYIWAVALAIVLGIVSFIVIPAIAIYLTCLWK